jgi:hypothetical protein
VDVASDVKLVPAVPLMEMLVMKPSVEVGTQANPNAAPEDAVRIFPVVPEAMLPICVALCPTSKEPSAEAVVVPRPPFATARGELSVANVPSPKFVRAVEVTVNSERLFPGLSHVEEAR